MAKAAALHGSSVDQIDQRAVAALPPDIYVVQFGKQLQDVAAGGPARSGFARLTA